MTNIKVSWHLKGSTSFEQKPFGRDIMPTRRDGKSFGRRGYCLIEYVDQMSVGEMVFDRKARSHREQKSGLFFIKLNLQEKLHSSLTFSSFLERVRVSIRQSSYDQFRTILKMVVPYQVENRNILTERFGVWAPLPTCLVRKCVNSHLQQGPILDYFLRP